MRGLLGLLSAALITIVAVAGCEAIVGGDLPAYACTPGDTNACPVGQVCSSAGVCVSTCPETACSGGTTCNADSHLCVPIVEVPEAGDVGNPDRTLPPDSPPDVAIDRNVPDVPTTGDIGSPCLTQASCKAGLLCADSSVLTADVVKNTGPVCTKTCCKSEDCPPDFACYGPGTGGNYCVRATQLPRGSARGAGQGGATCTDGSGCRSGVCLDANGTKRCADACCTDGPCPGGGVCALATVEGHITIACSEPPALGGNAGSFCTVRGDCNNGLCVPNSCRARCCGKSTCGSRVCNYLPVQGAVIKEYVPACVPGFGGAVGKVGDPCPNGDQDCSTALCDLATMKCTDVCCTDADCTGYPGYTTCRPDTNPNLHYLICSKPN